MSLGAHSSAGAPENYSSQAFIGLARQAKRLLHEAKGKPAAWPSLISLLDSSPELLQDDVINFSKLGQGLLEHGSPEQYRCVFQQALRNGAANACQLLDCLEELDPNSVSVFGAAVLEQLVLPDAGTNQDSIPVVRRLLARGTQLQSPEALSNLLTFHGAHADGFQGQRLGQYEGSDVVGLLYLLTWAWQAKDMACPLLSSNPADLQALIVGFKDWSWSQSLDAVNQFLDRALHLPEPNADQMEDRLQLFNSIQLLHSEAGTAGVRNDIDGFCLQARNNVELQQKLLETAASVATYIIIAAGEAGGQQAGQQGNKESEEQQTGSGKAEQKVDQSEESQQQEAAILEAVDVEVAFMTDRQPIRGLDGSIQGFSAARQLQQGFTFGQIRIASKRALDEWHRCAIQLPEGITIAGVRTEQDQLADWVAEMTNRERQVEARPAQPQALTQPLIFVHGYNNTFAEAVKAAFKLKQQLGHVGAILLYSWPSLGKLLRYITDRRRIQQSIDNGHFEHLLRAAAQLQQPLLLVAHSMGSQMLSQTLQKELVLAPGEAHESTMKHQIVFAAADVSCRSFKERTQAFQRKGRCTLYCADDDRALFASAFLRGMQPRAGSAGQPPLLADPDGVFDTIDCSGEGLDLCRHNYILGVASIVADLRAVLHGKSTKERTGQTLVPTSRRFYNHRRRLLRQDDFVQRVWYDIKHAR